MRLCFHQILQWVFIDLVTFLKHFHIAWVLLSSLLYQFPSSPILSWSSQKSERNVKCQMMPGSPHLFLFLPVYRNQGLLSWCLRTVSSSTSTSLHSVLCMTMTGASGWQTDIHLPPCLSCLRVRMHCLSGIKSFCYTQPLPSQFTEVTKSEWFKICTISTCRLRHTYCTGRDTHMYKGARTHNHT